MKNKLITYMYLFRSFESLILASTFLAVSIISGVTDPMTLAIFFVSVFCLNAGIVSWNDSLDLKEDSISHPDRPIISGNLSIKEARIIGTGMFVIGVILIGFIDIIGILLLIIAFLMGFIYSVYSKKQFLLKNLTVTILISFGLLLIPWYFNKPYSMTSYVVVVSFAFILSGYELIKDLIDVEGDAQAGIDTLPLRFKPIVSLYMISFFFIFSCLIMVIGFAMIDLQLEAIISLIATILLLIPLVSLFKDYKPQNSERVKSFILIILGIALSAINGLIYIRNLSIV